MMYRTSSCIILVLLCCGNSENAVAEFGSYDDAQDLGWSHSVDDNLEFWEEYKEDGINHTGIDYDLGKNGTHNKVLSNGFGFVTASKANGDKKSANFISVRHLIQTGDYIYFNFLHFEELDGNIENNKWISKKQVLGTEGNTGMKKDNDESDHLHFEVSNIGNGSQYVLHDTICGTDSCVVGTRSTAYDISTLKAYYAVDNKGNMLFKNQVWYDPNTVISGYQELLPYFSRTSDTTATVTVKNYDVYAIASQDIASSLYSTNSAAQINYYNGKRSDIIAKNKKLFKTQQKGDELKTGDYMLFAYIDGDNPRIGYPVKFSFLTNKEDRIVDNDQRSDDQNSSYSYTPADQPGQSVPGYFLTATLHKGGSKDTAKWCPKVTGDYNVFVHIPEYGATATNVVYNMDDINFNSIDQTKKVGEWVQLTSGDGKEFKFNADDCIKLDLSAEKNKNITSTQLAAFDAIKFEYVAENGGGKESETKLSIGYEKNARKQMVGDKVNISCYFKPSDEKNKVSYSIEVNNEVIPVVGKISATEPFILSATYEIPADKKEITIDCIADKKKVTEKISNIGSYSEPKNEHDIKEGDRIAVRSSSVDVYNCVENGDFYSATSIEKAPLGSQGNAGKVFFDKDGKKWRGIKWNTDIQISADNPCVDEDDLVSSFNNPCFFDDFKGKIVSAKQDVNCRKRLANGKIDMENNPVKIILETLGFSIENDSFSSDSYTWRGVSWYNEAGDHCYSAENYLNLTNFDDTPYFESVGEMCKMGVVDGYGNHKFGPHNTFSRAEITKVMINLLPILKENKVEGLPEFPEKEGEKIINYEDVAKEEYKDRLCIDDKGKPCWYYSYVGKATKAGIVEGYNDKEFKYNRNISHPELAKMVINSIVFDSKTAPNGVTRANWYLSESFQSDDIGKKCNFTTIDGKERLAWDCYNKNSQGNEEVWPDSNHWYCAYIYQSVGITTPIYDPGRASFIDITKDKVEKDTLRAEAMQSFYNAYLFRLKNKTYSLLNCENKN